MSDQSDDESRDYSQDESQEPVISGSSELVTSGAAHRKVDDDARPDGARPVKQITLKRLSAHSSWNGAFGDAEREEIFDDRLLRGEAKPTPGPNTFRGALPWFAMIAIAAVVGALSGMAATFGVTHFATSEPAATTLDDRMARLNADLAAVKSNIDTAAKTSTAKLAKLNETLDKLKPAPDITGSITPPPAAAPPASAPVAPQFSRLPVLEDWVLREVGDGGATVEGRQGIFEVFAGDPLPGVGRVDAIRRQDGRWVVVTSRGLIVAR